ncbi:MAG TPA: phosphoenolpyruvate--protein phosphotransferase [Burkholderiaceae bacterium]|nr:phosphoenolpyruvate--protein phosphotransferase [Burkholderiaceae bacterium]
MPLRRVFGVGVGTGVAIGRAHLLSVGELEIRHYSIARKDVVHEVARLSQAFSQVRAELDQMRTQLPADAPQEVRAFLDVHHMILRDALLADAPRDLIRQRLINAEWALSIQLEEVCKQFETIEDAYFRERAHDVRQVVDRVMRRLTGESTQAPPLPARAKGARLAEAQGTVLIAQDLAPADMLHLRQRTEVDLAGVVIVAGGVTSHTAILARSLGIPALVGAAHVQDAVVEGDYVVLDTDANHLVVNPDEALLTQYRRRLKVQTEARSQLHKLKARAARTRDGVVVKLMANIEWPEDARQALEAGADGVGLFRSEFLFLRRDELPSEDEQYEAYSQAVRAMKGRPVVIRTLDVGADKMLNAAARETLGLTHGTPTAASNPALGLRAIRYCLAYPELFLTQLRALLRASAHGPVRIMVPMLAHAHEIEQALSFVARAKDQLKARKFKFNARTPVGGMIEVPAAALSVPMFSRHLKFLSIGTNDLIQYTLAIDRADSAVAHLYDHLHPAVLHLVALVIRSCARLSVPVSVCGQMAGELELAELLLGMGLRQYSMHPNEIPLIKERLMHVSSQEAKRLAAQVLRQQDPEKVRTLIEQAMAHSLP